MMSPHLWWFMLPFIKIVTHKQEKQVTHTYHLIDAKIFIEVTKQKKSENRHHFMVSIRDLLSCVPFYLLSSSGKSLDNVSF